MPYSTQSTAEDNEVNEVEIFNEMVNIMERVQVAKFSHTILMGIIEKIATMESSNERSHLVKVAYMIFDSRKGFTQKDQQAWNLFNQVI
jgi:hypothetical protein